MLSLRWGICAAAYCCISEHDTDVQPVKVHNPAFETQKLNSYCVGKSHRHGVTVSSFTSLHLYLCKVDVKHSVLTMSSLIVINYL